MEKLIYFRKPSAVADDDSAADSVAIPVSSIKGIYPLLDTQIIIRFPNMEYKDIHMTSALSQGADQFTVGTASYNDDPTITHASSSAIKQYMTVDGTGIPSNAYVASVTDATHFELSAATTGGAKTGQTLTFNVNPADPFVRTDIERMGTGYVKINHTTGKHREVIEDILGAIASTTPFVVGGDDVTGEYISKHITDIPDILVNYDPDGLDIDESAVVATLAAEVSNFE